MFFSPILWVFENILGETLKVLFNNKKRFSSITLINLITYSLLLLSNIYYTKTLYSHILAKSNTILETSHDSPEFTNISLAIACDLGALIFIELIFLLITFPLSLLSTSIIITATNAAYIERQLSIKEVLFRAAGSSMNTSFTWFYITIFGISYIFIVSLILFPLFFFLVFPSDTLLLTINIFIILVVGFFFYLALVGTMGIVVSVIEEGCHGFEALGKASVLIKGKKFHGFVLNLLFGLLLAIIFQGSRASWIEELEVDGKIRALLVINLTCILKVFALSTYTVFYHDSTKRLMEKRN